jgi:hypothetical protein
VNAGEPAHGYGTTLSTGAGQPCVRVLFTHVDLKSFPIPGRHHETLPAQAAIDEKIQVRQRGGDLRAHAALTRK